MRRVASPLSALFFCGVCVLVLTVVTALAAPARGGTSHHRRARHASSCRSRAHTRRRSHHAAHCNAARHRVASRTSPSGGTAPSAVTTPPSKGTDGTPPTSSAPTSAAPTTSLGGGGEGKSSAPPESPPPSVPHVQVTAVEYSFSLSRTIVPAGKVIFQFVNHGQDEHNLNVALPESSPLGSLANTPAKGVGELQVELRPGSYTLFCSLPEHEQKGMKATLVVE